MNATKILGNRLRIARERRGLSQAELAEKCGLTAQQISNYETSPGKRGRPTIESVAAFASVLGCSTDWLLGVDNPPFTLANAAKAIDDLAELDGVDLVSMPISWQWGICDKQGGTFNGDYPVLIFAEQSGLYDFAKALAELRNIRSTLPQWEKFYKPWLQEQLNNFDTAESDGDEGG